MNGLSQYARGASPSALHGRFAPQWVSMVGYQPQILQNGLMGQSLINSPGWGSQTFVQENSAGQMSLNGLQNIHMGPQIGAGNLSSNQLLGQMGWSAMGSIPEHWNSQGIPITDPGRSHTPYLPIAGLASQPVYLWGNAQPNYFPRQT